MSHPVRGAWIEIMHKMSQLYGIPLSHPVRGAWIEIKEFAILLDGVRSRIP